jgi:hypothetical protein
MPDAIVEKHTRIQNQQYDMSLASVHDIRSWFNII